MQNAFLSLQLLAEVMSHNATIVYLNLESNRLTLPGIKVRWKLYTPAIINYLFPGINESTG